MEETSRLTGAHHIRHSWGWYVLLGALLVALGVFALSYAYFTTMFSMLFLGWLLIFSGVIHGVQAFHDRKWSITLLHLFGAILMVIVGFLVLRSPVAGALTVTILLAAYLLVGGLFRIFGSIALDIPGRGWMAFAGVVSFILGWMLWFQWPVSGLWVIGAFIGIDLIMEGVSWISVAFSARRFRNQVEELGTAT